VERDEWRRIPEAVDPEDFAAARAQARLVEVVLISTASRVAGARSPILLLFTNAPESMTQLIRDLVRERQHGAIDGIIRHLASGDGAGVATWRQVLALVQSVRKAERPS
jgi:hypothetical protein